MPPCRNFIFLLPEFKSSSMRKILPLAFLLAAYFSMHSQNPAVDLNFPEPNNQTYAVQYDSVRNSVYIGGEFTIVGSSVRTRFAALDATSGALKAWNPAFSAAIVDFKIAGNYLYAVGTFTAAAGSPSNGIAKFDLNTNSLVAWNPSVTPPILGIEYHNGKIYASNNAGSVYRIDTANTAGIDWTSTNDGYVRNLKIANGFLYCAGAFTVIDGQNRSNIAAFDISSGTPVLNAWAPDADNRCNFIDYYNGNLYVSGFFTAIAGAARSNFAEITAAENGAATVTSWDPSTASEVTRIKVKGNQLYYFSYPNPLQEVYLPTHTATTWQVNFSSNISWNTYGFDLSADKMFFGGGWNISVQGVARKNFAVTCAKPYSPVIDNLAVTLAPGSVCHGANNVEFEVNAGTGANSYTWTTAPSTSWINSFGDSASISFNASSTATQYDVIINASNGCMPTNTASVTINAYQLGSSIAPQTTSMICGGLDTIIVGGSNYSGAGSVSYSWSPAASLNTTVGDTVVSSAKSDVTYTLTSTSTEGCTGTDTFSLQVMPFTVNVTHSSQTILCSLSDSLTLTDDYPGSSAISYTWTPLTALDLSNPTQPVAGPVTSTDYTLLASSADGCTSPAQTVQVFVTPLTVSASASPSTITCGNSSTLTAGTDYPGTGTITYTWSPSADLSGTGSASPVASPTSSTSYNVDILTPEGCFSSGGVMVMVDPLQISTSGMHVSACGSPVTLATNNNSGHANLTYSWSPATGLSSANSSAPQASPDMTTIYMVTLSLPGSGCADAYAEDTVVINAPATPAICAVTVDDSSKNNVLFWDKSAYQPTDSFIIYRETTTGVYTQIAAQAHSALSEYVDTARSIGPANGDPNVGTYRYKLAVKDSCGNISPWSAYHNSVFFVDNNNGSFTWNTYAVENATTPVTQFDLMRDNANTGVWVLVGSVTGTQNTLNDPQYATYQSIANWRVEAQGFNCTSTQRQDNTNALGTLVKSKSNITNNRVIGIRPVPAVDIAIYPNPGSGVFLIDLGKHVAADIKVFSLVGEEVFYAPATVSDKIILDLSAFNSGTYLVRVTTEKATVLKKIIKQ